MAIYRTESNERCIAARPGARGLGIGGASGGGGGGEEGVVVVEGLGRQGESERESPMLTWPFYSFVLGTTVGR